MRPSTTWKISQIICLFLLALVLSLRPSQHQALAQQERPPLIFIENVGQFPAVGGEEIRFQALGGPATLSLTANALWFTLLAPAEPEIQTHDIPPTNLQSVISNPRRGVNLKLSFVAANLRPHLEPFNRLDTRLSYFMGNDPANWRSDVPVWGGVRYVDLYPGVDLEITSENGQWAQRLVVKEDVAAAEASAGDTLLANIRWQVEGADTLNLDEAGHLRLTTALGDFSLPLPQAVDNGGAPLDVSTLTPEVNGLEITAPFSSAPMTFDSSVQIADSTDLLYSTYLGGPGHLDSSRDIAVDAAGHAYVTGLAYPGFPSTPGVFDPTIDGVFNDLFIAKFNPAGSGLVYATFLGGNDFDAAQGISLDEAGNTFVVGYTTSPNFPTTPGALDSTLTDEADAFIAKLNADGTSLIYATLLGGSTSIDFGLSIASDEAGYAYVAGFTQATDFPTTTEVASAGYFGGWTDAFAAKIAPDGSALVYSVLLGGSDSDYSYALAVDEAGSAYLTGYTFSLDFHTTPGALDTTLASTDAFLVKLTTNGELAYATLLGGSGGDFGYALAVDNTGHAYLSGFTDSTDFPVTPGAFDSSFNTGYSGDAFVAKVSPNGSGLVYATYLGGNHHDYGEDLVVDADGSIYLTGSTGSIDFPTTPGAFDTACAGCNQTFPFTDVFVTKLHPSGALAYSTFLGGDDNYEHGYALALGGTDQVYLTGDTNATGFPTTPSAFDSSLDGFDDAFVAKLLLHTEVEPPSTPVPPHSCASTLLGTVTVGNRPSGLAVDSAHQRVYVANFDSNSVSVIDSHTNLVIQTIPGLTSANHLTHDPTHNIIWVTNYRIGQVTPIQANDDATGFTVLPTLAVGIGPWGIAYDAIHDFVYVVNSEANSITVINAASRTVVATLSDKFNHPFLAAAHPLTGKVYVTNFGNNSVTVLNGTSVSRVISLYDSSQPYGLAIDETRNLIYVGTINSHRIVAIGPIQGVPDQFLGWAAFHRGFGNPRRPIPLRAIAVNPGLGPSGDGGHIWATAFNPAGAGASQALFIPKGWSSYFHLPLAQNVGDFPAEGLAIDRATNRVYVTSGVTPGLLTVLGDHSNLCADALTKIASTPGDTEQPISADDDQIGVEIWENKEDVLQPNSDVNQDGVVDILDLALVASRFGSSDPIADLNADGRVDIVDLAIIANNYGWSGAETG